MLEELRRDRVDLVIFDNFTTLSDSLGDENSAGAMKPALTLMLKLKQAGIAAILVHHSNKRTTIGARRPLQRPSRSSWGLRGRKTLALTGGTQPGS